MYDSISSSSILHFTSSIQSLSGILKDGFKIKYCLEYVPYKSNNGSLQYAFPMVCFCDIPINKAQTQMSNYGKYGFGLSRDWAIKMKMNPVLYIDSNSLVEASITELFHWSINHFNENPEHILNAKDVALRPLFNLFAFTKQFKGFNSFKNDPSFKFYDEREWRYVFTQYVQELDSDIVPLIPGKTYISNKDKYNQNLIDNYLIFTIEDIQHIIVETDQEIPEIMRILEDNIKCQDKSQLDILKTRILSVQRLISDF
ncbi:abortive infection system antitoxin AbiGi family protein [Flectobacillus roseus]|uniref:abortive infection system antitoxin AbiGi family protein n=1 Tax=Flectobacillus roseus TaxID=502259 RepID=UPI0024B7C381|nr:abortive infection system antitoxin AbiGi family protein [Flectobacillus roseus]MDI9867705.1 abortive infection system antitoxin AbiGi family protein [Flectobacillus roseus]